MGIFWYDRPAQAWSEALPIGNGRLGAMVWGGCEQECLSLNQDSIWYGGPMDRVNPEAGSHLEEVRKLIFAGQIPKAERLLRYTFSGTPQSERPYQPLGQLRLTYHLDGAEGLRAPGAKAETGRLRGYRRELHLDRGVVTERFGWKGLGSVRKEYLASYPHGVLAIRITAEEGTLSFDGLLTRGRFFDHGGKLDESTVYMDGTLGEGGVSFFTALRARTIGGRAEALGEHLLVREAKEAVLYISCETSFYEKDWRGEVKRKLDRACRDGFACVEEEHTRDYGSLFHRVSLRLGDELPGEAGEADRGELSGKADGSDRDEFPGEAGEADREGLPMDRRLLRMKEEGVDVRFAEAYFQYGRYLLLSSSRPGSLPANLQGIWNEDMEPAWDSKFTININTEMNYWPAEICSLPECHLPLFDHLFRMRERGRRVAEEMYGCRGFVAHHNTDLWGDCAPQDIYIPATYWVMGGAWLCTHIWQHYLHIGDRAFLERMYPVLGEAVLFFQDYLVEEKGEFVTCPSVSPENTYIMPDGTRGRICAGASMDCEILRDLLEGYLKASRVLEISDKAVERAEEILRRLPPIRVGKHGQIMEWREDYEEADPGHRHISQLYALCPSRQITVDKTPELAEAARRTLERRLSHGGGYTGWSRAWIVNFYARLQDGEGALENLRELWRQSTFPNLMDTHPRKGGYVFQIDGNLGATAAMAEMLMQSDGESIWLLPALPRLWRSGEVRGLTAACGIQADIRWEKGALLDCLLTSREDREVVLRWGEKVRKVSLAGATPLYVERKEFSAAEGCAEAVGEGRPCAKENLDEKPRSLLYC